MLATAVGVALTNVGTPTLRTVATTNALTRMRRVAYVSATADLSSCGTRTTNLILSPYLTTAQTSLGSRLIEARFSFGTSFTTAGANWFIGFRNPQTAIPTVNPSTLTNMIGFGLDPSQTTIRFMHNDGAGTATVTDLGANFPGKGNTEAYWGSLRLDMTPTGPVWTAKLARIGTNFSVRLKTATDVPGSVLSGFHVHCNNGVGAGAVAAAMDLGYFEIETDQ